MLTKQMTMNWEITNLIAEIEYNPEEQANELKYKSCDIFKHRIELAEESWLVRNGELTN